MTIEDDYGKRELGKSGEIPTPLPTRRRSIWIESGVYFTALKISSRKFGKHVYMFPGAYENGERDCPCGCWMGNTNSGGPCDPFGPCPKNPRQL